MVNGPAKSKLEGRKTQANCASPTTWLMVILTLLVNSGGCRQSPRASEVIAEVNGETIAVVDFQQELSGRLGNVGGENLAQKSMGDRESYLEVKKKTLERMIEERVLLQEARTLHLQLSPVLLDEHVRRIRDGFSDTEFDRLLKAMGVSEEEWKKREAKRLAVRLLYHQIVRNRVRIAAEEAATYYETHRDDFTIPEQVHVAQIVVQTEAEAHNILRDLKANKGENFASLAKKFSLSPDAERGGDVGYYAKGQMPAVFDQAFALQVGALSEVIPSEYGFHLFKLLEKRPLRQQSLAEVAAKISTRLRQEEEERIFQAWKQNRLAQAKIVRHEDILRKL